MRWRDHQAAAANATPDAGALSAHVHIARRYGLLWRVPAAGRLGRTAEPSMVAAALTVAICSPISGPERARSGRPLGRFDTSLRDAREHGQSLSCHPGDANSSVGIPFRKDVQAPKVPGGCVVVHSRYAEWRVAKRTKSHVFRRAARTSHRRPARRRTRTAKNRTASGDVLMRRIPELASRSQTLCVGGGQPFRTGSTPDFTLRESCGARARKQN